MLYSPDCGARMVLFNYSTRELTSKIVYYGPGLCGKTTNLQYIYESLPENVKKGKMLSLATKTDRTLFFDFLPLELGRIRGMKTRVQLYTVPGQVFYNSTRKLVLKGADGVVFVADSQSKMLEANVESYKNLEDNLREMGLRIEDSGASSRPPRRGGASARSLPTAARGRPGSGSPGDRGPGRSRRQPPAASPRTSGATLRALRRAAVGRRHRSGGRDRPARNRG